MVLTLRQTSLSPAGFVKTLIAGPQPRVSDSVGLRWGLGIYIFNKFPSETGAAGPGTTLGEFCPQLSGSQTLLHIGVTWRVRGENPII